MVSPATTFTLDQLPVEILKRIASFTTAETAFSLIYCNKKLYSACYDPFVFRAIIENLNGHSPKTQGAWDIPFLPHTTPASTLARYAIADFKARSWRHLPRINRGQATYHCDSTHLKWAPHLATLGHPFVKELDLVSYVPLLRNMQITRQQLQGLLYVLQGAMLSHDVQESPVDIFTSGEFGDLVGQDFTTPEYLNVVIALTRCQKRSNDPRLTLEPPRAEKIPLSRMVNNPTPPFSAIDGLSDCYLKTVTSKEFIETGEWVGYYSYGSSLTRSPSFDFPMEKIKLRVRSTTSNESISDADGVAAAQPSTVLHISGRGEDNVGKFRILGDIHPDGRAPLVKTYEQGFGWNWETKMTPWGLMGFWGAEEDGSRHGWVWLWKKEWSR